MTWEGVCPNCRGTLFTCTVNTTADVHVNCANPECCTYIGKIIPSLVLHPLSLVSH